MRPVVLLLALCLALAAARGETGSAKPWVAATEWEEVQPVHHSDSNSDANLAASVPGVCLVAGVAPLLQRRVVTMRSAQRRPLLK
jgi:hypothetical protein